MGNGEGVEREADAAVYGQHLHTVVAVEGNALAAAVQGQVLADRERSGEGDRATTAEFDGVSAGRVVDGVAQGGVIAGIDGTGHGWLGVGRPAGKPEAGEHADPEQQGESDQACPGRETKGMWLIHEKCFFLSAARLGRLTNRLTMCSQVRGALHFSPAWCSFS